MGMVGQSELFSVEIKKAAAVDQWRWLISAEGGGGG